MHILPQLRKLEEKYRDTMVVIGVHSAKFDAEKSTTNIEEAVTRYNVRHPVVNDARFAIWKHYGVRAWPTLMFIDPEGKVIGRHEGEFAVGDLDRIFQQMIAEFDAKGLLNRELLPFQLRAIKEAERPLAFPGKIEADAGRDRLFIADSNHHRVIVTSLDGEVRTVIGNGESGGAAFGQQGFDEPVFDNPQGMAVDGDTVYVADAGSHTIKRVDLAEKSVVTIAGIGQQSLYRHAGGDALANPLNSPYDLGLRDGVLYVAMAGFHQLWSMDLGAGTFSPFAGTGNEDIKDGLRLEALLAQPYGLTVQGGNVFFADSETSSLRLAKIGEGGRVVTLVGTGLFDFGDAEGIGKQAMLQHPQGVAAGQDVVFIADTYNHRIKQISLSTLRVLNVAGNGKRGTADGRSPDAAFNEPAGLVVAGNRIYVADTNNHAIRVIDLQEKRVSTLDLRGL
ncbi:MAG: thioredoxin-like domain-containing protein [Chloroflexi bacterium]|nr:thioredoxin-like domain-containing protein [Chloroflexota bacterium]